MAHSISARKRVRQNSRRRARNRARASSLKTVLRGFKESVSSTAGLGKADEAFRRLAKSLDKAGAVGTIHRNTAARRKSRLARKMNAAKRGAPAKA